jgi:hypothetical protein
MRCDGKAVSETYDLALLTVTAAECWAWKDNELTPSMARGGGGICRISGTQLSSHVMKVIYLYEFTECIFTFC